MRKQDLYNDIYPLSAKADKVGMGTNIAILSHCFFTDNHLRRLRKIGPVFLYKRTDSEEKVISRLRDVKIAVANGLFVPLTKNVLKNASSLRLLVVNSTGFDFIDTKAAREFGVYVANTPGFSTEATAEHVFAMILAVARRIPAADKDVRSSAYVVNPGEKKSERFLGFTLRGKTLGLIGLGTVGSRVAELGLAFGMNVVAYNRTIKLTSKVKFLSLRKVLRRSDVVSLHLALVPETENIISENELNLLKPTSIIINTARGGLIDTSALVMALKKRKIGGAGLDVVAGVSKGHTIFKMDNVVFSPHSAWWTKESLERQAETIVQSIEAFFRGRPVNIISAP